MIVAGDPATSMPSGTGFSTSEPAATRACRPIVMFPGRHTAKLTPPNCQSAVTCLECFYMALIALFTSLCELFGTGCIMQRACCISRPAATLPRCQVTSHAMARTLIHFAMAGA